MAADVNDMSKPSQCWNPGSVPPSVNENRSGAIADAFGASTKVMSAAPIAPAHRARAIRSVLRLCRMLPPRLREPVVPLAAAVGAPAAKEATARKSEGDGV